MKWQPSGPRRCSSTCSMCLHTSPLCRGKRWTPAGIRGSATRGSCSLKNFEENLWHLLWDNARHRRCSETCSWYLVDSHLVLVVNQDYMGLFVLHCANCSVPHILLAFCFSSPFSEPYRDGVSENISIFRLENILPFTKLLFISSLPLISRSKIFIISCGVPFLWYFLHQFLLYLLPPPQK